MKRRQFITIIGGVAAWPLVVQAQQSGPIYRIGLLGGSSRSAPPWVAFFEGLHQLGLVEGQNLLGRRARSRA
jgi:putative tryptophan/tyrosine transport system substrate-binding protein